MLTVSRRPLSIAYTVFLLVVPSLVLAVDVPLNVDVPENEEELGEEMIIRVKAKKKKQKTSSSSSTEVSKDEIKKLPMGGEASLSKLITSTTPGVTQGAFGQMFFRGNHGNVQYLIDGVQVPDSPTGTFGQVFSPRNIESMEILTGGIPAEYGQRLGAVVNMTTKTGTEVPSGELELNYGSYGTASPHLLYGGSNSGGDVHYYVGLSMLRTNRGLDTPQPLSLSQQEFGGADSVHNNGSGDNEFAKVDWQVSQSNRFSVSAFNAYSSYQIPNFPSSFRATDPLIQPGGRDKFGNVGEDGPLYTYVPSHTDNQQSERNTFIQTVWHHTFANQSFFQLAPYYKFSHVTVMNDPINDLATLNFSSYDRKKNSQHATESGSIPIESSHPVSFAQNRHVNDLGLRADYTFKPHSQHQVKTGFMSQVSRTDGWFSLQYDLNTGPFTNSDPATGFSQGVYLQDEFTITPSWILNAGMRFDATQFSFSGMNPSDSMLQPRLGLTFLPTDTTQLHVFYGKLFQPVSLENIRFASDHSHDSPTEHGGGHAEAEHDEHDHHHDEHEHEHHDHLDSGGGGHSHDHAVATPMDLKAEKSDYYEAGISQRIFQAHTFGVNVYYKDSTNVIDEHQLFRTPISQVHNFARGYAYGAEFSVRGDLSSHWSQYFNYTYSIAKGQEIGDALFAGNVSRTDAYQMLDHVQMHTANAGITFSKWNFWWAGQSVFGSGLRTGPSNDIQLPGHLTFDTTVGYEFTGRDWFSRFRFSADVLNILDTSYPITIANGYNSSQYAAGRQIFLRIAKSL